MKHYFIKVTHEVKQMQVLIKRLPFYAILDHLATRQGCCIICLFKSHTNQDQTEVKPNKD